MVASIAVIGLLATLGSQVQWTKTAKVESGGTTLFEFGTDVALDGGTLIATRPNPSGSNGDVRVLEVDPQDPSVWVLKVQITENVPGTPYPNAVDICGDTAVAAAAREEQVRASHSLSPTRKMI